MKYLTILKSIVAASAICASLTACTTIQSFFEKPDPFAIPHDADEGMALLVNELIMQLPIPLTLGIEDFKLEDNRRTSIGDYLQNIFITNCFNVSAGTIDTMDEEMMNASLKPNNYSLSMLHTQASKTETITQLLPVDALASTTLLILDGEIRVTMRIISSDSGKTIGAKTVRITRLPAYEQMIPTFH